jgi:hypothetical protein
LIGRIESKEIIPRGKGGIHPEFFKRVAPAVVGGMGLAALLVVGMMNAPSIGAQTPQVVARSEAAPTPKFEVASIKPCRADIAPNGRSGGGNSSPGRLNVQCQTVMGLIQAAYVIFANGHSMSPPMHVPISGGPSWINSDRYTIDAKQSALKAKK